MVSPSKKFHQFRHGSSSSVSFIVNTWPACGEQQVACFSSNLSQLIVVISYCNRETWHLMFQGLTLTFKQKVMGSVEPRKRSEWCLGNSACYKALISSRYISHKCFVQSNCCWIMHSWKPVQCFAMFVIKQCFIPSVLYNTKICGRCNVYSSIRSLLRGAKSVWQMVGSIWEVRFSFWGSSLDFWC